MTQTDTRPAAMPPHDIAAEQAVIGSMMLSEAVIADMAAMLRPGDFYRPIHGLIFTTIIDMFGRSEPVDVLTVMSRLMADGELARVGGAPYLSTCTQYAMPASAASYARTVAERATDRAVGELGAQAVALGSTPGDTDRKVAMIRDAADALTAHREVRHGVWVRDAMVEAIDAISDARDGTLAAGIVPTPYRDLNRLLGGGLRPGTSTVVGARPGIGKSTMLLDLLRCAARFEVGAELISLEMTVPEIMQRYLSAETNIPYALIRTGQLNGDDEDKLARRIPDIRDRPLLITDASSATMGFIRSQVRRGVARDNIRVFGLDYIGLVSLNPKVDRREGLGEISRGVKLLAKENGVVMITASQLNRNPASRRDKRPDLADLRETGDIEQDADVVILIHDPTDGDPTHARAGEIDFIVAKHRGGPTGTITVANQQHRARFADIMIA
jgi:replicative DNA helicase